MNMPKESDLTEYLSWRDERLSKYRQALVAATTAKNRADWVLDQTRLEYSLAKENQKDETLIRELSHNVVEAEVNQAGAGLKQLKAASDMEAAASWFTFGLYWGEKHKDDDTLDEEEING